MKWIAEGCRLSKDGRVVMLVIVLVILASVVSAQEDVVERLDHIDRLDQEDRLDEAIAQSQALIRRLDGRAEEAEALWRLSRAIMKQTNLAQFEGLEDREAIDRYQEGASYAKEAQRIDPTIAEAYFWEAANRGSVGKTRGVLNSLFMASDLDELLREVLSRDDDYPEPYFMLGTMYRKLPGRPISFGDKDAAVSFGRLAVALHEAEYRRGDDIVPFYDYYLELAMSLWERDWRENKRNREQQDKRQELSEADGPFEEAALYEAEVPLSRQSDRDEALELVRQMESDLSAIASPSVRNRRDLEKARELLAEWE